MIHNNMLFCTICFIIKYHFVHLVLSFINSTKETRRGRHKGSDKSPTKKKRHKKKQEKPKKIPKISEEEIEKLTKIKTEVLESESLLDPTSGTIAETTVENTGMLCTDCNHHER